MPGSQAKKPIYEAKDASDSFFLFGYLMTILKNFVKISGQVNAFGIDNGAQQNRNTKGKYGGQNSNKGVESSFKPKPFITQQTQPFSQFSKTFLLKILIMIKLIQLLCNLLPN